MNTIRGGPVHSQAGEVAAMMTDPARCQVVLVTLPETTPVNEAVETAYALEDRVGIHLGPLVVNGVDQGGVLSVNAAEPGSALRMAAEFRNARRTLHSTECSRLADELALPQMHLPLIAGSQLHAADIEALADALLRVDAP
jgi:hypothetical protein